MLLKTISETKFSDKKNVTEAICNCCRRPIWLHASTHSYKYYIKQEELFIGTTLYYHSGSATPQYCLQFQECNLKKKKVPSENSEFIFQCQNCQIILPLTLIPLKLFSLLPKHLRCRKRRQLQVFPETFPCSRAVYIPMNQYSITTLFHQHLSPFFLWHIKPHKITHPNAPQI